MNTITKATASPKKIAIIFASSKLEGNTRQIVSQLQHTIDAELFILQDFTLSPFDYDHKNRDDDFLPLMRQLIEYDHLVFATPMYWYSMSAQLKVFFDRMSDLVTIEKDLGRKLRGIPCSVVATGNDQSPPACFEQVFRLSFDYLSMPYRGMLYCSFDEGYQLADFAPRVKAYADNLSG